MCAVEGEEGSLAVDTLVARDELGSGGVRGGARINGFSGRG